MRIAALDLGSNSFHLVVVEARPDGTFDVLAREKAMLRLGDAVARTGVIGDALADEAVETVARFRGLAEAAGSEEIVAMATSAIREADDSATVLDRIQAEAGLEVEVISGAREAQLIFEAIRASVLIDPGPALAADLGGGSVELMVGDQGGLWWSASLKLGAARLTAELVRSDPPSDADTTRVRKRVAEAIDPLVLTVAQHGPVQLVGSSGTLCSLVRMVAARASGVVPASVNQMSASLEDLRELHRVLAASRSADRARVPGLDEKRADIVVTGSTVLLELMEAFGFRELTVSEWALREGMVLDVIGTHHGPDWDEDPRAMRLDSVLSLCRRCGWNESHARQVATLAVELFDRTVPLHGLGPVDRELLEHGALLHDIGEHVAVDGHDRHTAYLVMNGNLRGFSPDELSVLACLGRFHRRGSPRTHFDAYEALSLSYRERVTKLVALLRVADALDRSHTATVTGIEAYLEAERVVLRVLAASEIDLDLWGLRRKRELFEQVFKRSLRVEAEPA